MAGPRMNQLRPGVSVNIVLKKDQSTGKLTTGQIADILTRGDHPRGIKVRLADGQIGRVQSLSTASTNAEAVPPATQSSVPQFSHIRSGRGARGIQDDYRLDPQPADTTSLLDYVKAPRKKKGKSGGAAQLLDAVTPQEELEAEFPMLDSALVAAILANHESDLSTSRTTLSALS